jgi:1,4-dihydroxy-6-naphthoate synthase
LCGIFSALFAVPFGMKLSLAYSPCPNDCFIFDALIHKKIDTGGLDFEVFLEDVETLNQNALQGKRDITKLSFHAYAYVMDRYILLRAGSALGFNCGPLLIHNGKFEEHRIAEMTVAIPGKMTTANFLLSLAYPQLENKREMVFSDIEDAVLNGEVEGGLIIHENRFTYEKKGLKKIRDLGEFWESLIHAPIPLGGIVIKRDLGNDLQKKVNALIRKSVEYAFAHPESSMSYVREHAQAMEEEVMKKHIALYVNEFSIDLGERGEEAVRLMFKKADAVGVFHAHDTHLILSP